MVRLLRPAPDAGKVCTDSLEKAGKTARLPGGKRNMEAIDREKLLKVVPEAVEHNPEILEDWVHIISGLSSLFFATYYVNLDQDTFRPVTQLRRVEGLLGDEVNYTAALQIYANHFIHPDDRELYLRTFSMENLRESLRWWQPCVAMEYRQMHDEPGDADDRWRWVRASVVLTRTGPDDLPQTSVYVAQDLTVSAQDRRRGKS